MNRLLRNECQKGQVGKLSNPKLNQIMSKLAPSILFRKTVDFKHGKCLPMKAWPSWDLEQHWVLHLLSCGEPGDQVRHPSFESIWIHAILMIMTLRQVRTRTSVRSCWMNHLKLCCHFHRLHSLISTWFQKFGWRWFKKPRNFFNLLFWVNSFGIRPEFLMKIETELFVYSWSWQSKKVNKRVDRYF